MQLQQWYAGPRCFCFEPLFVPRTGSHVSSSSNTSVARATNSSVSHGDGNGQPTLHNGNTVDSAAEVTAEDDGWVLATMYDAAAEKGMLVIFDAQDISHGPVAKITLPHHLPSGLHGSWTPHYFGPQDSSKAYSWTTCNTIKAL